MKIIIQAGGKGTRMGQMTKNGNYIFIPPCYL